LVKRSLFALGGHTHLNPNVAHKVICGIRLLLAMDKV